MLCSIYIGNVTANSQARVIGRDAEFCGLDFLRKVAGTRPLGNKIRRKVGINCGINGEIFMRGFVI